MDKRGALASYRRGRNLGCLMQAAVLAMLPVWVGLAIAAIFLLGLGQTVAPFVLLAGLVGWAITAGGFVTVALVFIVRRRNRLLDAVFVPLGLHPRRVSVVERGFLGQSKGRGVRAWFSKGPQLELYVDCRSGRRLGVAKGNLIIWGVGERLGSHAAPAGHGLTCWSDEGEWADALVQLPGVSETFASLCGTLPGASTHVIVGPEAVKLSIRHFHLDERTGETDLSPTRVGAWVHELASLADAVEQLPAGTATEGRIEGMARLDRGAIHWKVMGCTAAVLLALMLATVGVCFYLHLTGAL